MANKIMLIMVINLFVAVALAVFNVIYIQKKMDIRYPSDATPLSGRGESAGQNPVYETDRGVFKQQSRGGVYVGNYCQAQAVHP